MKLLYVCMYTSLSSQIFIARGQVTRLLIFCYFLWPIWAWLPLDGKEKTENMERLGVNYCALFLLMSPSSPFIPPSFSRRSRIRYVCMCVAFLSSKTVFFFFFFFVCQTVGNFSVPTSFVRQSPAEREIPRE